MDRAFFNMKTILRRNPEKYMRNPAKVFASTHFSKKFALYDLPGYQNELISKKDLNMTTDELVPKVPSLKLNQLEESKDK